MKDLRERCEKFLRDLGFCMITQNLGKVESFAREIRHEAIWDCVRALRSSESDPTGFGEDQIRELLNTDALAAMANTKEVDNENV